MNGIINFETFILAGILLNLTPGNDTIFILSRSIAQGKQAGIMSVLGIATGSIIHTTLAAFGLSLIIAKSIIAFHILKYAGAVYLIYIGYKMLTDRSQFTNENSLYLKRMDLKKIYRDGVITNVLNPKVALFFIAFLPQFIDPSFTNTILPFMLLGITFTITGTLWCFFLASFSAAIAGKLTHNKKLSGYITKTCGAIMIGLAFKVAFTPKN
ncbi:MAG: LysE family translocator [Chitinophagaceae bacterium]